METTPCDVHEYDSDEYNSCIKDIVYEQAQDEWIMLDPRFPNLKGITPKRIDEFLAKAESLDVEGPEFNPEAIYNTDKYSYLDYALGNIDNESFLNIYSDFIQEDTKTKNIKNILNHYEKTYYPTWDKLPKEIKKTAILLMYDEYKEIYSVGYDVPLREDLSLYFEDYLQHVMVYDRDDIISMCYDLGQQIEKKYPEKLHSDHSIFVTTPRGGHEVLSIFAYTNDLKKNQIPSHIKGMDKDIYDYYKSEPKLTLHKEIVEYYEKGNHPIISDIWLDTETNYFDNKIETVFVVDDVIASGEQMSSAMKKLMKFFRAHETNIEIIPIVLVKRKNIEDKYGILRNTIYDTETVGIEKWDKTQSLIADQRMGYITPKPELVKDYDKLITVRFPWGSPDGESDKILTTLYESRRGLERIERKERRCRLEPDKCELK